MIEYIGVNDHVTDLFEGQYRIPNGMSYNSYLVVGDSIAVMDTVDGHFVDEWLLRLKEAMKGKKPDYLVLLHMEPDHSAGVKKLLERYPETEVVGNPKTFAILKQFFPELSIEHMRIVKENDVLSLGGHELKFIFAPMVHWPEVMMAYETTTHSLFSADAFGKFGALDIDEGWKEEARRYYIGIVGKYGAQVQALLKKLSGTELENIYPLHGPALRSPLDEYLALYDRWSAYLPETEGVLIAYASIYGHTKCAVEYLCESLKELKCEVFDLARCDPAEAIAKAFQYPKMILATPTYNAEVFPPVKAFLSGLKERNYQNRKVGIIENGSWAPMAKKYILDFFAGSKGIEFMQNAVTIRSAVCHQDEILLDALAAEIKA